MQLPLGGAIAFFVVALLALPRAGTTAAAHPDPGGRRTITLGDSVDGRPIVAVETGDFDASRKTLVVGCIHGDETAGVAIADRLARATQPRELDLWIIPTLNPDGVFAQTRGNADGVDLNRNFPWHWRPLEGSYDSGPHPLPEPESRIAHRLIISVHPGLSIWFHQHLDVVDESGGSIAIERRFARLSRLRLARLTREPGSVVGWGNHRDPSTTAFVVELQAGRLTQATVKRLAVAVIAASSTTETPANG